MVDAGARPGGVVRLRSLLRRTCGFAGGFRLTGAQGEQNGCKDQRCPFHGVTYLDVVSNVHKILQLIIQTVFNFCPLRTSNRCN